MYIKTVKLVKHYDIATREAELILILAISASDDARLCYFESTGMLTKIAGIVLRR